jgi:hypothetical protein
MMDDKNNRPVRKSGRNPKKDPAVFRYSISFNEVENARFLSLFEQSGMHVKAHFIKGCVFQKTMKTIKIDMAAMEYHTRLTTFYSQFRAVGVNYNHVVKILYRNFSEKKAAAYLFKLEKQTAEMVALFQKVVQLTQEFEAKHLKKDN